jgi:hypothetical protein
MRLAGLIESGADIRRFGSDGRPQVLGETGGSTEKCDRNKDCGQARKFSK